MAAKQRLDIQILRAVAVSTVVLFHLWPNLLPGGYVGVDVFFVISGFLISGHIQSQISGGNRFSFRSFYARRIRRLLPAASLVLFVTLVATFVVAPWRMWASTASQVAASSLGYQNWLLAFNSVDYFSSNSNPSPVMHYWSLSLEEQFYLIWPVLLLLFWKISSKFTNSINSMIVFIGLVALVSLSFSVYQTENSQSFAYFNTFTHVWEFCLGALLAIVFSAQKVSKKSNSSDAIIALLGFAAIIYSAFVFNAGTKFPGFIALIPVLGTLFVIYSGRKVDQLTKISRGITTPLNWVGNNSYSIYLWHWPPIVLLPFVIGHNLSNKTKVIILVGTLILAWLTTKYIEKPLRFAAFLSNSRITYLVGAVTVFVVVASSIGLTFKARAEEVSSINQAQVVINKSINSGELCFGATAMSNAESCANSHIPAQGFGPDFASNDWGTLSGTRRDGTLLDTANCADFSRTQEPMWECSLGATGGDKTMAVVGDSHALALLEPLVLLANKNGYQVQAYLQNSCSPMLPLSSSLQNQNVCDQWRSSVAERIAANKAISIVVATGFSRVRDTSLLNESTDKLVNQYSALYKKLADSGKQVFVIEDVPLTSGESVPECVELAGGITDPCSVKRELALSFDPVPSAIKSLNNSNVHLIELTDQFCDLQLCHSVIGGLIAYRDSHHVSGSFALTLLPSIEKQLAFK